MLTLISLLALAQAPALADVSELKAAFNAADGKVRVVMLVSPT